MKYLQILLHLISAFLGYAWGENSLSGIPLLVERLVNCTSPFGLEDSGVDDICSISTSAFVQQLPFKMHVDCSKVFSERIAQRCERTKAVSYQQLFTDYMLKNRPFIARCEKCESVTSENNFLARLGIAGKQQDKQADLRPQVLALRPQEQIFACPLNLSMVVWGLRGPQMQVSLRDNRLAALLDPAARHAQPLASAALAPRLLSTPPTPLGCAERSVPAELQSAPDTLFVPHTFDLQLPALQHKEGEEAPPSVYAACLLDASNFHAFLSAAQGDYHYSAYAAGLRLLALPSFGRRMHREGGEEALLWADYVSPAPPLPFNTTASSGGAGVVSGSGERRRRRGGSEAGRGWKEAV
eukprot:gene36673-44489_t